MSELEFREVLNIFDIDNPLEVVIAEYGTHQNLHYFEDLTIHYDGINKAVIHGKILTQLLNNVFNSYDNFPYKLDTNKGYILNEDISNSQYIQTFNINTKEALLIFLSEVKDYYLRKDNKEEMYVSKEKEMYIRLNENLLRKINIQMTPNDWVLADPNKGVVFKKEFEKLEESFLIKNLRAVIKQLDEVINPYLNGDIKDFSEYMNKIYISYNDLKTTQKFGRPYRNDSYQLTLTQIDSITRDGVKSSTEIYLDYTGFHYSLIYNINLNETVEVQHIFLNKNKGNDKNGEAISFNYSGSNNQNFIYNLTDNTFGEIYFKKDTATDKQIEFVYEEVLKAIEIAKSITLDNMKNKEKIKRQ